MTTKKHSRFVTALGNGNYLTVTILRLLGASGIIAVLGAMFWVGSTSQGLQDSTKQNTEIIKRFIEVQTQRDARQDERMGRQDKRMTDILRHLMSKP
jgi:flagellar basal body-associated protein FliL